MRLSWLIAVEALLASTALVPPAAWAENDAARRAGIPEEVAGFRKVVKSQDVETFSTAALALRRWMIEKDPHRPLYHFTGPESWINDANGVIYHQGKYHLFCQFDPIVDGRRSKRCWGHAVSDDLVHWIDWPVAIWPDSPHDRSGVYSGNVTIDDDGFPVALYTGNVAGHRETYGILARSTDGFRTWQKKTVMHNDQRPNAESPVHWDAQVWKEGPTWCQLIGGTTGGKNRTGAAFLWTSPDLEHWTLQKPIYSGPPGGFWELPYLLSFGAKDALLIGVRGNRYWVGSYDRKAMTFTPDYAEPKSMDPGTYYAFNPHMVDDKGPGGSPRRIMHGWVLLPASPTKTVPYWQGAHAIPRVLTVEGEYVVQQPVPEIEALRGTHRQWQDLAVQPGDTGCLPGFNGDALEIIAVFDPTHSTADRFGVKVRVAPDGSKAVRVWYDPETARFGTDGIVLANASASGAIARSVSADDAEDGLVTLRIFVDRSILEVYCGGAAVTNCMFPDPAAIGVDLFAEGGTARVQSIDAWEMQSAWSP